ncbi:MAG: hypothetical protein ACK4PN_18160 [Allorhizobium sp.]
MSMIVEPGLFPGHAAQAVSAVPFHPSEIFFSRTDERGKILAGNAVFQRISQYGWDELLGRPHNVIRHADMPRGVFWLLWDRIRKGRLTGAYVKNRARDGRHYWVFAIVAPAEGGYLSVRIKPASATFALIAQEYARLLALEAERDLTPAESGALVTERLAELGFRDYDAFMAYALTDEVAARNRMIERGEDRMMAHFRTLMEGAQSIICKTAQLSSGYADHQFVPLNLLVQAGRLGQAGSAIGTISGNYSLLSEEIRAGLSSFSVSAARVAANICEGAFMLGTARIQQETISLFASEPPQAAVDHAQEMSHLTAQEQSYRQSAREKLIGIRDDVEQFHRQTLDLKRLASGLSAIRVMGKVESGRLSVAVLADLIADLEAFQAEIAAGLAEIALVNQDLRQKVAALVEAHGTLSAFGKPAAPPLATSGGPACG